MREALEGIACPLAVKSMTEAELADLDGIPESHDRNDDLRSGVAYYQQPGELDFHYRIARASRNRRLVEPAL